MNGIARSRAYFAISLMTELGGLIDVSTIARSVFIAALGSSHKGLRTIYAQRGEAAGGAEDRKDYDETGCCYHPVDHKHADAAASNRRPLVSESATPRMIDARHHQP